MSGPTVRSRLVPVLIALAAGFAVLFVMVLNKRGPEHADRSEVAHSVRVIAVRPMEFMLEARGFGAVVPGRIWHGVASVSGRVTWRHPELETGNILPGGTRLIEIDPTRYKLAVAGAKADLTALVTERRQLEQERANTAELLSLEEQRLELSQSELSRIRKLTERGTLSPARLDEQERLTLQQRSAVQAHRNRLGLIPSQLEQLAARIERAQIALDQARQDLNDTEIFAPFDIRVASVDAELGQHVTSGQRIVSGDGIDLAEAVVQIPLPAMRRLLAEQPHSPGGSLLNLAENFDLTAIAAELRLVTDPHIAWPARFSRMEGEIDPATRTVQVVVSVDDPYRGASPPERLPLVRGMYVEARLSAPAASEALLVPQSALHQGAIYVADEQDRLRRVPVELSLTFRDLAAVSAGLSPGDRVIVDDVVPAIEGMALAVRRDLGAEKALAERAAGASR